MVSDQVTEQAASRLEANSRVTQVWRIRSFFQGHSGFWAGILFTMVIALVGTELARLPGLHRVGPLACSIVIAVGYRQIAGYPRRLQSGIQFSGKRILRFAIILYGIKLNIDVILHQGLGLLARDVGTIAFSMVVMALIARYFKAPRGLSVLLGIGTGVCGASAIAAVSPLLDVKEEDTAMGAGMIALMGTVFAIVYTVLRPLLPLTTTQYGMWCGVSIHEVAQVALAAAPAGSGPLAMALLAKLGRVFLLVPLSLGIVLWRSLRGHSDKQVRVEFPWFLVGFVVMSLVGTYAVPVMPDATHVTSGLSIVGSFLLTASMVGLGLNVSLRDLRSKAMRPLLAMTLTSILLSGTTLLSIWL